MDENQIKPKLLVVGDSFMTNDIRYPGHHWSEMITEYEVINLAQGGASNFIINYNLMQGLKHQPDAVVIGFTDPFRIEVSSKISLVKDTTVFSRVSSKWITNLYHGYLNDDCQAYIKTYRHLQDDDLNGNKAALEVLGILSFLKQQNIKTVFSYGLFEGFLTQGFIHLRILAELEKFKESKLDHNLVDYITDINDTDIAFHVNDQKQQRKFAKEVVKRLSTL